MKRLTVVGHGGVILSEILVNAEGDDFAHVFTMPLFLPVVSISLLEIDKKETKRIRSTMKSVEGMIV